MNRIILIGNGFDLAHGLPTTYQDFLNDFWLKTIKEAQEKAQNEPKKEFENNEIIIDKNLYNVSTASSYEEFMKFLDNNKSTLTYKNKFLKRITKKKELEKWVDVENEYYFQLKKILNNSYSAGKYNIKELNRDFCRIKELLREYLFNVEEDYRKRNPSENKNIISNIGNKIYFPFKYKDFTEEALNQKAEESLKKLKNVTEKVKTDNKNSDQLNEKRIISKIGISSPLSQIKRLLLSGSEIDYSDLIPDETLFLNFNYTSTNIFYIEPDNFDNSSDNKETIPKVIHIHGTINKDDKNPIIFGFGDELDDDYKSLEKINDNNYLENIKSINYLETANYKNLLEFISKDNYQIFIMGHSCGTSDRTLLNTIFEHSNCKSIKIFYHQINEEKDNFIDLVKNISRNFNDKAVMRDKVVNKTYCEPLIEYKK